MNPKVLVESQAVSVNIPQSQDVTLPEWLNQCLISQDNHQSESLEDSELICSAFNFAYRLHQGQYRKSGEPYIAHPIAVADLLHNLGGDAATVAAGFLHDVVEDTEVTSEEIEERFGTQVRLLVDGVTKLSKLNFSSKTERQAENFRRMFLAMAKDIRVIVVKLADRLHNMRTLQYLPPAKQKQKATETREIFAPLANRLGIGRFKWELEDLSFKYLEPEAYRQMQGLVTERRADREERLEKTVSILQERLQGVGIKVLEVKGRPKHLYGIYQKMQKQQKEFHEIYDVAAVRIILDAKEDCYRSLAIVHDSFKPIPGRFKDYIGLPKPNRYQSLHTTVVGLTGKPLEVQIRTMEMHQIAEYGIAAHWKYKESGGSHSQVNSTEQRFTWLRQLLEWQKDLNDAQEYVDNLKDNLFDDDVYVFTPQGDVIPLTRGATPIDFAYHIHTEVGNHMKGARVNGRWSVLGHELKNGDIVEIITQNNSHPTLDWLNYVVTPTARNRIRQWYKRHHRQENIAHGKELLEKALGKAGFDSLLKSEPMQAVAKRCNYQSPDDLLAALGYGEITLNLVLNRLQEADKLNQTIEEVEKDIEAEVASLNSQHTTSESSQKTGSKHPIAGVEGLLYHIAGCCSPLPGEPILGVVTRNARGIAIHGQDCKNVANVPGERLIPVSWNALDTNGNTPTYPVNLEIKVIDRVGILKDILIRLSDQKINIGKAGVTTYPDKVAVISLCIDIRDRRQLESIVNKIKNMSEILNCHYSLDG